VWLRWGGGGWGGGPRQMSESEQVVAAPPRDASAFHLQRRCVAVLAGGPPARHIAEAHAPLSVCPVRPASPLETRGFRPCVIVDHGAASGASSPVRASKSGAVTVTLDPTSRPSANRGEGPCLMAFFSKTSGGAPAAALGTPRSANQQRRCATPARRCSNPGVCPRMSRYSFFESSSNASRPKSVVGTLPSDRRKRLRRSAVQPHQSIRRASRARPPPGGAVLTIM